MLSLAHLEDTLPTDYLSPEYLQKANEQLRRLLYSTARQHNRVFGELQSLKAATGLYTHGFRFLSLPLEIRQRVYRLALRAPEGGEIEARRRPLQYLARSSEEYGKKAPTAGLLRANKQIYHEAVEVLLRENCVHFHLDTDFTRFVDNLGKERLKFVREIKITVLFADRMESYQLDPFDDELEERDEARSAWASSPQNWEKVLRRPGMVGMRKVTVVADYIEEPELVRITLPADLKEGIERLFGSKQGVDVRPKLILQGGNWAEEHGLPGDWEVKIEKRWTTERWWRVKWENDMWWGDNLRPRGGGG